MGGERKGEGKRRRGREEGGEALAVEPSHFSTGSDATDSKVCSRFY